MARTSNRGQDRLERRQVSIPEGLVAQQIILNREERPDERRQRLRKEFLSFLVHDLLATLVAIGLVIATGTYCFWVMVGNVASIDDRNWAISVLASLFTALTGFVYGRATR